MTKLLVSVRDAAEAQIALDASVDLIDVKEPRRGSLGKADNAAINEIVQLVNGRRPVSAALGELSDYTDSDLARPLPCPALQFVKIGLARCAGDATWSRRLAKLWENIPGSVGRVAVIYADWQTAAAPPPPEVLQHAVSLKCSGVLIDTYDKSLPGIAALWQPAQIQEVVVAARSHGMISVLAGRISRADVAQLLHQQPDFLAVRGAVCFPDRNGTMEAARILSFRKLLAVNLEFASQM